MRETTFPDDNDKQETDVHVPTAEEIKERIAELEKRKAEYEKLQREMEDKGAAEISTTDPDARLMAVNNNGVDVCYDVQTAVDQKNKLVVDYEVITTPSDQGQLSEMAGRAKGIFRREQDADKTGARIGEKPVLFLCQPTVAP